MLGWKKAKAVGTDYKQLAPVYVAPYCVFDYSQGRDLRWNVRLITAPGVCQGLAIFWVIKSSQGINFCDWLGPPKAAASWGKDPPKMGKEMDEVIRVMEQQEKIFKLPNANRALNTKWAGDRIRQRDDGGGGTSALKQFGELALLQGATPKQLAAAVTNEDGYVFIGMSGSFGGHAMAAWVANPIVHFFDPNYGEYYFDDIQAFHTWFEHSLLNKCYKVSKLDTAEIMHFQ